MTFYVNLKEVAGIQLINELFTDEERDWMIPRKVIRADIVLDPVGKGEIEVMLRKVLESKAYLPGEEEDALKSLLDLLGPSIAMEVGKQWRESQAKK